MEPGMSKNEFLAEDGHGDPEEAIDEPSDPLFIAVGHYMQAGMSRDKAWDKVWEDAALARQKHAEAGVALAIIQGAPDDSIMGMVRNIKKLSDEIL